MFSIDVDKLDKKLIPSKDEHGLLRAHGRLENMWTMKCAILLSSSIRRTVTRTPTRKTSILWLQEPCSGIKKAILDCGSTSHGKTSCRKICDFQETAKEATGAVNEPDS